MVDSIQQQVDDLASRLQQAWSSLPDDDTFAVPRERDANYGRRTTLMYHRGPLLLAHQAWREAHARLDVEEARRDLLQSGVDHFAQRLSTLPNHDPQRFDVHHAIQVLTVGLSYDHGSVRTPLVQWAESHGGLHLLSGPGLTATERRVEDCQERVRVTWNDLWNQMRRVELLVAPTVTTA